MHMDKSEQLDLLYNSYKKQFHGSEIVLGSGNIDAQIILIGEAPGKDEVRLSKPFVGMAGKNLSEFLDVLGLERDTIYITNAIKYRLSKLNEKTGKVINRPATQQEISQNREYLMKEIDVIKPKYIVTLGNVPLRSVLDESHVTIGEVHGKITSLAILKNEYLLFPLYHPASIIYNRNLKDTYIADLYELKKVLEKN